MVGSVQNGKEQATEYFTAAELFVARVNVSLGLRETNHTKQISVASSRAWYEGTAMSES